MFITFYGRDFRALADNSSLYVEKFKLIRRAYDFNEFSATCEPIDLDIEPMFATIKHNDGTHYYDMLRPIVTKNSEGKSSVNARDLLGVFNTECVVDFTRSFETIREYLQYIFDSWKDWDDSGFDNVTINLTHEHLTSAVLPEASPAKKASYNIKDILSKALMYYDLYIESKINMRTRTLEFTVKPNNATIMNIRLEDFGIEDFAKSEPETNTAVIYDDTGNIKYFWYLLRNGNITRDKALRNVFPTAAKVFYVEGEDKTPEELAQEINQAHFDAVMELAENRYRETIEINAVKDFARLQSVSFDTSFNVYYRNAFYKTLPLGEIEEDGTDNKILRIGFKPLDFIQVV